MGNRRATAARAKKLELVPVEKSAEAEPAGTAAQDAKKRNRFRQPLRGLTGVPGVRIAVCTHAAIRDFSSKSLVTLTFVTEDDEVGRLWVEVPDPLVDGCRYLRLVDVVEIERQLGSSVDPQDIFVDERFEVMVGYRQSPQAGGRGKARGDLLLQKKDDADFLRVVDLIRHLGSIHDEDDEK